MAGGGLQVLWWKQEAADNQLKVTVESISISARVRRRQESGRCGRSEKGSEGGKQGQRRIGERPDTSA